MQTDQLNNLPLLEETLTFNYDLSPTALTFLPAGEDGLLYRFQSNNQPFIAKIVGFRRGVDKLDLERKLGLIHELASTHSLDFIVSPLAKHGGGFVGEFEGHCLVVYPFVQSILRRDTPTTPQQIYDLGGLIGRLHSIDPSSYPFFASHDFSTAEAERLGTLLNRLSVFAEAERMTPVCDLLNPWEARLRKDLDDCMRLRNQLRGGVSQQVITHSDLSPGNILFTPDGAVRIIDWEGIKLSLPEEDISLFSDSRELPFFLEGYLSLGKRPLQQEAFRFFKLQWQLEGIVQRIELLLQSDLEETQRQHELEALTDELSGHRWFDVEMAQLTEILASFA